MRKWTPLIERKTVTFQFAKTNIFSVAYEKDWKINSLDEQRETKTFAVELIRWISSFRFAASTFFNKWVDKDRKNVIKIWNWTDCIGKISSF